MASLDAAPVMTEKRATAVSASPEPIVTSVTGQDDVAIVRTTSPVAASSPSSIVRVPNSKRPPPFSKKLTKSLFIRPADQVGNAPNYKQSIRNIATYSWLNVLLICNPIAWALHYTHQNAAATFTLALLGVIPLAGMLGFGTEAIALYTGDALGGLINASLGNATEFIIAILLLVKCEIRVVQASLLGGLLSNLLLVLGMAFLVGGARYSEQEFQQTAAQLNTNLMTLAVVALIIPSAFAFALESAVGEDKEKAVILQMSRGSSIILIFIYISYMVFQLYSHAHYYNPAADEHAEYSSDSSDSEDEERTVSRRASRRTATATTPTAASEPKEPVPAPANGSGARKQRRGVADAQNLGARSQFPAIPPVRRAQSLPFGSAARLGGGRPNLLMQRYGPHHQVGALKQARFDATGNGMASATGLGDASGIRRRDHAHAASRPVDLERASMDSGSSSDEGPEDPELNIPVALGTLLLSTGLTYLTAEALTDSLETIGDSGSVTPEWLGLILLAVVGNAAEHVTAVFVAYRNKVDLALAVSVGSCIQIALFVIPLLVLIGWMIDKPLSLLFDPLETVTLFLSVLLVRFATEDGRTHYMSGIALLGTYVLIAFSFWFYPSNGTPAGRLFDEQVCQTHDY
ncbi:calcium/proton exchanger [Exidia glandulosa HHB12029]|uniref:Calcium/proton exchanger n=1 Tax=Exidia glandulosa HHB12029 TaxID=1314781 RepID=A0A165AYN6_EXIGL|nr:calcium/proton exchanger [Exidia glandulosa HHB12029]